MPRQKIAPAAPSTPEAAHFAATVSATLARLGLDDTRGAVYLGVPVPTIRKWRAGVRAPSAAAVRLIEILGLMEAIAPGLHAALVPPKLAGESSHVKKSRKVSPQN